jgi:DNA-directed RNA polymerase subunit RPC12/RpoP
MECEAMSITVQCSGCGGKFRAYDKLAGRRGKCPKCSGNIVVPEWIPEHSI